MSALVGAGGGERLHALDAVRGGALMLGVFFHATMSFMEPRIWIVGDNDTSPALTVTFFVLHIFRMTMFFMIAGFFARLLLERRGAGGFVKDRLKRIGIPLVAFWPFVFAAIIAVAIWAAVQANGGVMPEGPPPPPLTAQTFPLTHLWFLYVLLIFYAGALMLRGVSNLIDRGGALGRVLDMIVSVLVKTHLAVIVLAAPAFFVLANKPDWMMWFGIPTPDTGVIPNAVAMTAYGVAFSFGWLLHRQIGLLSVWEKAWPLNLGAAVAFTAACLWFGGLAPSFVPAPMGLEKFAFAGAYVLAAWTWSFALVGLALRFLNKPNGLQRYVSDASYWIYIVHLPAIMVLQVPLATSPLPALAKYAIIVSTTIVFGLATYHMLVRYSWLGAILNGRKHPRRGKQPKAAAVAAE